jgi:hypothetical protein
MPGKSPPIILLVMILFGLLFTPAATLTTKDYIAEKFDIKLVARYDGSIMVTETIVFRFSGGPFTYVFREIPVENTDGITGVAASMDGRAFPTGIRPQLGSESKDSLHVTCIFTRFDSTHTFILKCVFGVTCRRKARSYCGMPYLRPRLSCTLQLSPDRLPAKPGSTKSEWAIKAR